MKSPAAAVCGVVSEPSVSVIDKDARISNLFTVVFGLRMIFPLKFDLFWVIVTPVRFVRGGMARPFVTYFLPEFRGWPENPVVCCAGVTTYLTNNRRRRLAVNRVRENAPVLPALCLPESGNTVIKVYSPRA